MPDLDPKGEGDKSMAVNRWPGPGAWDGVPGDPRGMAKAGLLESQSPAAAIYCDQNGTCRCPSCLGRTGSPWATFATGAMPSEGIEGDEWGACSRAETCVSDERGIAVPGHSGGDGALVVVAGVATGRGGRESRPQGEGAQVVADDEEPWRYA
jgi:hypothetical protein